MAFRHYDMVKAISPSDFAKRLTRKLKEGQQPFGSPMAITPYTLMQAIAVKGDVATPVVVKSSDGEGAVISTISNPEHYFVAALAGQSNGMAYGEGLPLLETYDCPDPRIRQLARRNTVTPGGASYNYNDIISADHCLHDVQDPSKFSYPKASAAQYGHAGQGLHTTKKLLPFISANAGVLLVPCCRGGSAFLTGDEGTFSEFIGASGTSVCWGIDKPLYRDLLTRTQATLKASPKNIPLAVVWMQGESDLKQSAYATQPGLFDSMVEEYRSGLPEFKGQCLGGSLLSTPRIRGDATYYWKQTYSSQYGVVCGAYETRSVRRIFFVPFMMDENGRNVGTNEPSESSDVVDVGYYGVGDRTDARIRMTADHKTRFGSWACCGITFDRLATVIPVHAGRNVEFVTRKQPDTVRPTGPSGEGTEKKPEAPISNRTLVSLLVSGEDLASQGWRYYHKSTSGDNVSKNIAKTVINDAGVTGGKTLQLNKPEDYVWFLEHDAAGQGVELLKKGGRVGVRFKLLGSLVPNQFALGIYWQSSSLSEGVVLAEEDNDMLMSFFLRTDVTNLSTMRHKRSSAKLGTFGVLDNGWHTLASESAGNSSIQVTPVLGEKRGTPFTLVKPPAPGATDKLQLTGISKAATYTLLIDGVKMEVNNADIAA